MKNVSDEYMQTVSGSVVPKCEPVITLSYFVDGVEKQIEWRSKDLKGFSYKQGGDPLSRTAPYIEFVWSEFYFGDINKENMVADYADVSQNGLVQVRFEQSLLAPTLTWADYETYDWGELSYSTWGELRKPNRTETIEMPDLYLNAQPEFKNGVLTWKAVDLLSLMSGEHSKVVGFEESLNGQVNIPIKNVIANIMLDERAFYINSPHIINAITETVSWLMSAENPIDAIATKPFVIEGTAKSVITNLSSVYGFAIKFDGNKIKTSNELYSATNLLAFPTRMLKKHPTLKRNATVSAYQFKRYVVSVDREKQYSKTMIEETIGGVLMSKWEFDGLGYPVNSLGNPLNIIHDYHNAIIPISQMNEPYINVRPIVYDSVEGLYSFKRQGEAFVENNPLNVYGLNDEYLQQRYSFIRGYFDDNRYSVDFEPFTNLAFEVGDIVGVETNLKNNIGENIIKDVVIVEMQIEYNGALKEKIKAHQVGE